MNPILLGVGLYVIAQLAIGVVVSFRIRTQGDYVLAGRSLGYVLATFSIYATWFGAETCIGTSGEIYTEGLSAAAHDPFGYSLCILLMGLVFAVPLWRRKLTTIGDLFRERYSHGVERLAVLLMVPTSLPWAAAQVRASGQVLSSVSSLDPQTAINLAAAVVIVYTVAGGLLADAITDLVQGAVLAVGLVVVFVSVVGDLGGLSAAIETIDASRLNLFTTAESRPLTILNNLEAWLVPICGSVVAQELIARILAARSPQVARRSSLAAAGLYLVIGLIPLFIGLVGPGLFPGLEHSEQLLSHVAQRHASALFSIVFIGALISAILSTVDSALLAAATLTTENLVASARPISEKAKLYVSRAGVIVFGLSAYGIALASESVYDLVGAASSFGSAGIFTIMVFGLFSRRGRSASAYAALIVGVVVWVAGEYALEISYPYVASLAASVLVYGIIAGIESRCRQHATMPTHG